MRKHIAYLIAGLIAGLILGMLGSAGGEEEEIKEEEKQLSYFLNPELPIDKFISVMDDDLRTMSNLIQKGLDRAIDDIPRTHMILEFKTQTIIDYMYIQNHRLLLQNDQIIKQNERIIELLEEIRDK